MSGPRPSAASLPQVAAVSSRRGVNSPRFTLAIPAWLLFIAFFVIPVLWILYYSFGYKPLVPDG